MDIKQKLTNMGIEVKGNKVKKSDIRKVLAKLKADEYVLTKDNGQNIQFWTGNNWHDEYPEAEIFSTLELAKKANTKSGGSGVIYKNYGTNEEVQAQAKKIKAECPCQNRDWGFFGVTKGLLQVDLNEEAMEAIYMKVLKAIVKEEGVSEEIAVEFLDSVNGRHLADELSFDVDNVEFEKEVSKLAEKYINAGLKDFMGGYRWKRMMTGLLKLKNPKS